MSDLPGRIRALAKDGYDRKLAARELGITLSTLDYHCQRERISLPRMTAAQRLAFVTEHGLLSEHPSRAVIEADDIPRYTDEARELARVSLQHEVALARAEILAGTAPPYKFRG